jgi:hypothetical protein
MKQNIPCGLFFDELCKHLNKKEKKELLKTIVPVAAAEHWLTMEAAYVADTNRAKLGIDGEKDGVPIWHILPERGKVDLWISNNKSGTVIEFKAIHNNKNFAERVASLSNDACKAKEKAGSIGIDKTKVDFMGIAFLVYTQFAEGQWGGYQPLGGRMTPDRCQDFFNKFEEEIAKNNLKLVSKPKKVCSLDGAHYIKSGVHSSCWLAHIV